GRGGGPRHPTTPSPPPSPTMCCGSSVPGRPGNPTLRSRTRPRPPSSFPPMRPSRPMVLVAAALLVVAAACGGGGGSAKKRVAPTTPKPTVAPLTGLPDPNGESLGRPALSGKIENTPEARPQTNLDAADVVFEEVTEGEITRFVAVYDSTIPAVTGPIRARRASVPAV